MNDDYMTVEERAKARKRGCFVVIAYIVLLLLAVWLIAR